MTSKILLLSAVFFSGASVMTYELIGSRVLAPYFGTGITVWSVIIGVVLASLSIGYWYGGIFADKGTDRKYLGYALLASGFFVLLTPLIDNFLLETLIKTVPPLIGLIASTIILLSPASVAFGLISPWITKLFVDNSSEPGRDIGIVYIVATMGSIVGTILTGLVLIPNFGITNILYGVFVVQSVIGLLILKKRIIINSVGLLFLFLSLLILNNGNKNNSIIFEKDTPYARYQGVLFENENNQQLLGLKDSPKIIQSVIFMSDKSPAGEYTQTLLNIKNITPKPRRVLILGGGTMVLSSALAQKMPSTKIDVVEIDPFLLPLAINYFGYNSPPNITLIHQDARFFLNQQKTQSYDVVVVDIYRSETTIPFHLTTIEAVRAIKHVAGDGYIFVNIIASPGGELLRRMAYTWKNTENNTAFYQITEANYNGLANVLLVYNPSKITPDSCGFLATANINNKKLNIIPSGPLLTDDFAPVDFIEK